MKNKEEKSIENAVQESTALARIFGEFLKRKSSGSRIISEIGEKLVSARSTGDSFITLEKPEIDELEKNSSLLTGNDALLFLEGNRLYLYREYRNEKTLARLIADRLLRQAPDNPFSDEAVANAFPKGPAGDLKPHKNQIAAVRNCLESNFSIITGGPGTGKTTIIAALVALELERDPGIIIEIAAPTGKAAELLTKGLAAELPQHQFKARTVHSLFKAKPGTGCFGKTASDPLECDLLIVDECSMINLDVAAKMFSGLKAETRVVLSGDHRQLEAIGSGDVLSSLLTFASDGSAAAGILKKAGVELTENYRAEKAPSIQFLAHSIREEIPDDELCEKIVRCSEADYQFRKMEKTSREEIL